MKLKVSISFDLPQSQYSKSIVKFFNSRNLKLMILSLIALTQWKT